MVTLSRIYVSLKILIPLVLTVLVIGCDDFSFRNGLKQGKIEYAITYPAIPEDNYMLDVMPKKMETSFVNNSFRNDIIAGMGLIKTSIIFKKEDNMLIHSFKMLNEKYFSELSSSDLKIISPDFQDITINLLNEQKEIAGYHCSSAEVTVNGDSTWSFKVFYTNEINIKNANQHTPFKEIDGVLMEYEINSYDTHMKFTAEKVIQTEISDEEIDLDNSYKKIEPQELKEQIVELFDKVK